MTTQMMKRFVLVRVHNDRFGAEWTQWRATCPPLDVWFWRPTSDGVDAAREFICERYPDACFSDEVPPCI